MANIEYSIFNSLAGWTSVNTSPSGGTVSAIAGEGVIDRTSAGTNYDDMGIYRTNAVTAAIGHVIYIDVKLSAVTLGSGSHGLIILKDATGIERSSGGYVPSRDILARRQSHALHNVGRRRGWWCFNEYVCKHLVHG